MADIKSKIIEIVGDEVKAEEVVSSLWEFMIPKEQYNKKVQELNTLRTEKETLSQEIESAKVEKMSADEKLKHELEKVEGMKRDFAIKSNLADVKTLFASKGIVADEYDEIIQGLVSPDAETTKKLATGVLDMIVKQTESAVARTKEEVVNSTPSPNTTEQVKGKTFVKKEVY